MRYCKECILPDTRPSIIINEDGVCNACKNSKNKKIIDWGERERLFRNVINLAKTRSKGYDCVIPVSGGKDSTWQVIKCLEYGLNPLAVTWKTPVRTEIGAKNLDNLVNLGVDHIDYQVNPKTEKEFTLQAFKKYGAAAIPMHMAVFHIPIKIAIKFNIPLIIWGENSAFEYGSKDNEQMGFQLDEKWLKTFGVTQGTTAADWVSADLTKKELTPYFGPKDKELEEKDIKAIFLGYYFEWNPLMTYEIAKAHGFQARKEGPKTGYYDYADIDDEFIITIHHFLKWYKFGFTRTYDNLSMEIRNGRLTRKEAVDILREKGEEIPTEEIKKFSKYLGISKDDFFEIAEKFRNKNIWVKKNNKWIIENFLISDWKW